MWVIHARLPPETGTVVVKAIEAAVEENGTDPLQNVSAETPQAGDPCLEQEVIRPSFPQARADALEQLAEHFLASSDGAMALKGAERCQVQLHVSLMALRGAAESGETAGHSCHLEQNQGISPDTARRLCCDASLVAVLEDEQGRVLNIGRRSRTVPPSIRRALALRDKTCRVPGCCETRYVDAHHIVHWADGGETSLDNLITLCRRHHRALHRGVVTVHAEGLGPERRFIFTRSDGRVLPDSIFPQFRGVSAETSAQALQQQAREITPRTCVTRWQGEYCDYGMAIDGLLDRDCQQEVVDKPPVG